MIPSDQQSGDQLLVNWQTVGSELASWAEAAAAAAAAGQGATPAAPHHGHNSVQDWESAILQLAAPQHHSVGPSSSYSSYGGFHDVVPPPMLNTIMQAEPILPIMSSSLRPHPQHQLGELLAGVNSGYGASTSTWGLLSSSGIRSSLSGLQEVGSSFQASLYSSYPNNRAAGAGLPASLCSGNSRVHYDQENGQKSSGLLQLGTQLAGSLDHRTRLEDIVKRELQNTSYTAPAYDVGATRLGLNLGLGRTYFSGEDYLGLGRLGKRLRFNSPAGYSCFSMQQQHVQAPLCQAEGCKADLGMAKHYHRRHKVCEYHSKAATVLISGQTQRFCQQCSRFHDLSEFDDGKRSCRKRLADHNRRRRKPQPAAAAPAADQGKPSDDKRESDQPQDVATSAGTNVKEYAPGTPPAEHKKKAQELITLENLTTTTAASTPESTTDHELKMMKEADLHNTNNKVQGGTNNWTKQDQRQGSMMSSSSSLSWLRSDLQSDGAAPCMKQSSAATLSDTEVDEHAERGPLAAQHGAEAFASMSKPLQAFLLQGRRGFHDAGDDDHDDDEDDGGAGCGAAAAACSPEDPRHGMHGGFFMSPSHVPLQVPNTAASLGLASPAATCSEMISHPSGSPPHDAATPSFGPYI